MKKNVIISLADSKYFDLLNELIDSIKRFKESEKVAFCVLDAGLNEDQLKILNSKVDFKKSKIRETELKMYHLSFTDFTFLIVKKSDSLILKDVIHESTTCLDCS